MLNTRIHYHTCIHGPEAFLSPDVEEGSLFMVFAFSSLTHSVTGNVAFVLPLSPSLVDVNVHLALVNTRPTTEFPGQPYPRSFIDSARDSLQWISRSTDFIQQSGQPR
uniref:GMC_oxred_C domain-containing protein n=1 Tax=Steinernema glaseri TaxID=37863 RepID=A0A1I7ZV25_9BILA